jgi:hypothetical protein
MYVSPQINVHGDIVATANNILAKEFLFRTGIVSSLLSNVLFLFLVMALYRLFKQVNEHQAKLMVVLVIVQIPINFILVTLKITSLMILKGEVLHALEPEQLQNLFIIFREIQGYGVSTNSIFIGLWLIPFGLLVYKSGFIPRILGVLLIISGITWIIDSFTLFLLPGYHSFVSQITIWVGSIGEPLMILWLLIKGVKKQELVSSIANN